ncbi:MAG: hypothetical protein ABJE95_21585 [Byssovorax sp.]
MGARDSDDDIRKYIADVDSIVKGADPVRRKEQLLKAQDNPELDQALEELSDGLKEGESPFAFPILHLRPKAPGVSEAKAPNAAPPVTTPIPPVPVKPGREGKRRALPSWRVSVLAVLAALSPVAIVLLFLRLHGPTVDVIESPRASAQAIVPSAATAEPAPPVSAPLVAPSASTPPPAPAVDVDAGGSPSIPTPPASSAAAPRLPVRPPPTPRPVATDIAP